ncbi:hypothetical protein F4859DRAFT_486559 [Xylaria cf. heliscus]|nr:hypothetical protein F4859DRAFT_486559 [Xylaria cf. heliscus]
MPLHRTATSIHHTLRTLLSRAGSRRPHLHHPYLHLPFLQSNNSTNNILPRIASRTMASAVAKRLAGKTVVITGASSGIGRSTAFEFARTAAPAGGLKLVLTARRIDALRQIAADIAAEVGDANVKVLPVQLDVSKPDEVRGFVDKLPDDFKEVDVLVNNAGLVKGVAKAPEIAEEDLNIMFSTNVTGLINMTQAILPIFLRRPDGGRGDVITIGSIAGREPYAGGSIYCATKAAVRSFTDSLRKELIASRVRVLEVDPGQVETVGCQFFFSWLGHSFFHFGKVEFSLSELED